MDHAVQKSQMNQSILFLPPQQVEVREQHRIIEAEAIK